MKKSFCIILSVVSFFSCKQAGTIENVGHVNNPDIEVYRYYLNGCEYVYIAKFKNSPITTTTYSEHHGKGSIQRGVITLNK